MKLPLETESLCGDYPDDQSCIICGRESLPESQSSLSLDVSTLGLRDPETLRISKTALSIHWMGNVESNADNSYEFLFIDVVKNIPKGQGRIHFCSTTCLRQFFADVVDEVENEIQETLDACNQKVTSP